MAYPTEGVYGLGCNALDSAALERLLAAKRRAATKGLILLYSDVSQVRALLRMLPPPRRAAVLASWPGPVTWLLPAPPGLPALLRGATGKVAVRVTAHPVAAALCRAFGGAVTSTSANISGRPVLRSGRAVRRQFGRQLAEVVPAELPASGLPSAVVDALSGEVLRAGAGFGMPPATLGR